MSSINQFSGKTSILDRSYQAAQHSPKAPKGARIPHITVIPPAICSLPMGILLSLSILSSAFYKYRQMKFRLFPLIIKTNRHSMRGRKDSERTTCIKSSRSDVNHLSPDQGDSYLPSCSFPNGQCLAAISSKYAGKVRGENGALDLGG